MARKRKQHTGEEKLAGREAIVFAERKRKLAEAREARARRQQSVLSETLPRPLPDASETGAAYAA